MTVLEENEELCNPRADVMVSSLRAFGYDLSMAFADLIDNSIFAKSKNIHIDYDWNNGNPWIRILDDGKGMSESILKEAMRPGSKSAVEERAKDDLGRFGLGLKTASFSQCKLVTVCSKTSLKKQSLRCWDLDYVKKRNNWILLKESKHSSIPLLKILDNQKNGTLILWENLDRIIGDKDNIDKDSENLFLSKFKEVAKYLEMVFHRYLSGKNSINIFVGSHKCKSWDPFMLSNSYTQVLVENEKIENDNIRLSAYVLPHVSKRSSEETSQGAGLYGWNAHQGLYIYRNKRMIISGGYLDYDLSPEEHYKLGRIKVDIPNNVDHLWGIDVRKKEAYVPLHVRKSLEKCIKSTRNRACEVYRARAGKKVIPRNKKDKDEIWIKQRKGDKIYYSINKNNLAIKQILNEYKLSKLWINKLFYLIESEIPYRPIIMENLENEDCHVNLPDDITQLPEGLIASAEDLFRGLVKKGKTPSDAINVICYILKHPAVRAHLDKIFESEYERT